MRPNTASVSSDLQARIDKIETARDHLWAEAAQMESEGGPRV
jgi:hypothetical protein